MTYHVYQTPGIILHSSLSGESNLFLLIFTRELGLIKTTARGSRLMKSKLRYGLQKYNHSQFSFVYGRYSWRLTGAVPKYNSYYDSKIDYSVMLVIANVCALLQRLLAGEEKNQQLFDLVMRGFFFLKQDSLSKENLSNFEFLFVLRILYNLGYISGSSELEKMASSLEWNIGILKNAFSYKQEAVSAINRAIHESHL